MKSVSPGELPVNEFFTLLLGAVAPRPIAFASTIDKDGNPNLSPFSFFNIFGSNPPIVIFSPSRRGRDAKTKHTHENVKEVPEVVINLVNYALLQQVNLASAEFPKGVNEFVKAGLTQVPSDLVRPFRVKESPVQLECKVLQVLETGTGPAAGNLVICEVIRVHVDENILDEKGHIDQTKADWIARMGADYYCRAHGDALFRVAKPREGGSIGIDMLPQEIRSSHVFTGNDLGIMGNINSLPAPEEIITFKEDKTYLEIIQDHQGPGSMRDRVHEYARQLLGAGEVMKAIGICTGVL
jgi:flavin reductase (DIM6/NTAB) family NADH-FMN oxidoreductase RutF